MTPDEGQTVLAACPLYRFPATFEQRDLSGYGFDWELQPDGSCKLLYRSEADITPVHILTDYGRAYFYKYGEPTKAKWAALADRALWKIDYDYADPYGEAFGAACAVLFDGRTVPLLSFFKTPGLADEVRDYALSLAPVVNSVPPTGKDSATTTAELRYCFDSTNARDIPAGVAIVAGYIDGLYAWSDEDWALFPDSVKVRIAVFAGTDGDVLDVEPGDATPEEAVGWVTRQRSLGGNPTVYCGLGQWDAVRAAFARSGVSEPNWWIAHYDNDPTPIEGAFAKQYANPTFTGKHYDISVVSGTWPGVEGDDMDRATFDEWFRENYERYEVAKTFDALKEIQANQQAQLKAKAELGHGHNGTVTVK